MVKSSYIVAGVSCFGQVTVVVFWQETLDEVDKDKDGMISRMEYLS